MSENIINSIIGLISGIASGVLAYWASKQSSKSNQNKVNADLEMSYMKNTPQLWDRANKAEARANELEKENNDLKAIIADKNDVIREMDKKIDCLNEKINKVSNRKISHTQQNR
ncbi:hypothetical protein IV37_GL000203 [Fructilactobacillus fructivorans]|uniref:hypothetical protein n=1 Tax=Fructilactobacillus fructivorans TaxID=1614 RepID=UPI0007052A98|nr:hypothetical protein [Fructilactobacillus fructivorans]KRN13481.1 hypothetical protein IV37_GL000203 [Fructilactobacillus fructivorans]